MWLDDVIFLKNLLSCIFFKYKFPFDLDFTGETSIKNRVLMQSTFFWSVTLLGVAKHKLLHYSR